MAAPSSEIKVYAISKEPGQRIFDMIVYGATGFTGKEVCKYICRTCTDNIKWAIAGRSQSKLGQLKSQLLAAAGSTGNLPDILVSDADDTRTLQAMFAETRLVLNCTGPYRFLGKQVVEACLAVGADYMDICGEPQFMESCFLDYHSLAEEKGVLIVHACAFDSVPADLGCLFTSRQFPKDCCTQIESFLHIDCPKGLKVNYTTFECAVHGVGDAASLKDVRKKVDRKYQLRRQEHHGPKLQRNTGSYYEKRVAKYAIPFLGADASVVRQTQRLAQLSSGETTFPQYAAYACLNSLYWVATAGFYGTIFSALSSFEMGRNVLLSCPEALTAGVFSKEGPSRQQLDQTSFEMHFYALGYSEPLPEPEGGAGAGTGTGTGPGAGTAAIRTKGGKEILSPGDVGGTEAQSRGCEFPSFLGSSPAALAGSAAAPGPTPNLRRTTPDRKVHVVVTGPEPGYVATPAIFVSLALCLGEERGSMPRGGVMTPAGAWAGVPGVFARLRDAGVGFRVVGTSWDEGLSRSRAARERERGGGDGGGGEGGGGRSGDCRSFRSPPSPSSLLLSSPPGPPRAFLICDTPSGLTDLTAAPLPSPPLPSTPLSRISIAPS